MKEKDRKTYTRINERSTLIIESLIIKLIEVISDIKKLILTLVILTNLLNYTKELLFKNKYIFEIIQIQISKYHQKKNQNLGVIIVRSFS